MWTIGDCWMPAEVTEERNGGLTGRGSGRLSTEDGRNRVLELNHGRYAVEVNAGLHGKTKSGKVALGTRGFAKAAGEPPFFDQEGDVS